MDDPWGSPWTSEQKPPSPTKSACGLGLEPPPRAFLSTSSSPRIPTITGTSPWADDDDGFGDWAAPDVAAATPSGWVSGWVASEGEKSPHLTPVPKDEVFGKRSPIAVPGSIALTKSSSGSVFRQPSPLPSPQPSPSPSQDPWSSEFSLNFPLSDNILTPRYVPQSRGTDNHNVVEQKSQEAQAVEPGWGEDIASPNEGDKDEDSVQADTTTQTEHEDGFPKESQHSSIPPTDSVEPRGQEDGSRRSSFSGDDSMQEVEQQDSPITSIDEDSRARLQVQRKVSGKVQELVEKYDGIARQASEEPPSVIKREPATSCGQSPDTASPGHQSDESDDFGDLEDAVDEEEGPNDFTSPASVSPERTPTPGALRKKHVAPQPTVPEEFEDPSTDIQEAIAKLGDVKFEVKWEDVDKLFSDDEVRAIEPADAGDADVSDRIVSDSFTEISERKTWYRISRQGSSRKHNAGDDDNYKLVAWPTSSIHLETIKIVRRWMEEDSITGRITLGGGATRSNMFGWDSAAEPVSLDKVFGKRTKTHSRTTSLQQLTRASPVGTSPQAAVPASRKASGTPKSPTQRPLSLGATPAPSFGWSTVTVDGEASNIGVPVQPPAPKEGASNLVPLKAPSSFLPPPKTAPPPANNYGNQPTTTVQTEEQEEDDDDDWGEMVSTPQTTTQASTTSQGLDIFSTPMPAPKSAPVAPFSSSRTAHTTASPFAPSSDPWSSVDFSFFDKPTPSARKAGPMQSSSAANPPPPLGGDDLTPVTSSPQSRHRGFAPPKRKVTFDDLLSPPADKSFSPTTPIEIVSPIPVPATTPTSPYPPSVSVDDQAVNLLLQGLPNLSYMLR